MRYNDRAAHSAANGTRLMEASQMAAKTAEPAAPASPATVRRNKATVEVPAEIDNKPMVHDDNLDQGAQQGLDSKRRMPDTLRRYLLKVQGGKFYLPAAYRIVWFRDECPDWGVETQITEGGQEAGFATVKATVYNPDGRVIATGHKTETRQDFPAGWVEKAETGAVARALALVGFGTQFSPELDEEGYADSPLQTSGYKNSSTGGRTFGAMSRDRDDNDRGAGPMGEVWEGPGQCPRCHAPQGKRHGKPCIS